MNAYEADKVLRGVAGVMSGRNVIGEVTEAIQKFLLDGYNLSDAPPRMEEDLQFVPKDREEVVYVYMYRMCQNPNLLNRKRLRQAPVFVKSDDESGEDVYYHRPPLLLDLFYYLAVHSKFRSDAERLMGWVMLRLNEATHLIYRPRRFVLPDGREVDSLGRQYDPANFTGFKAPGGDAAEDEDDDGLFVEKVSLAMVDDLTLGDAINFYTLQEAPFRPWMTYRARVALDGPLYKSSGGAAVRIGRLEKTDPPSSADAGHSPNGRVRPGRTPPPIKTLPGPKPYRLEKKPDEPETEE